MAPDLSPVAEALRVLEIRNLVLGVHAASLPLRPDEDLGRGTPYGEGADRFFSFAAELGFTGVQLGPQGLTSEHNPSPYDGTLFSRNPLDVALWPLVQEGLLPARPLEEAIASRPPGADRRVAHRHVFRRQAPLLEQAYAAFIQRPGARARLEAFRARHRDWLLRDGLYDALCLEHGQPSHLDWGQTEQGRFDQRLFDPRPGEETACAERVRALEARYAEALERYALVQWLAHEQHLALRRRMGERGLKLFGDLQIGVSVRDTWSHRSIFLPEYLLGAPPSRTNPEGQPWGYPVLDPRQYGSASAPGPALTFVRARMDKMLAEYDAVRIDHPHGLVCPWVYRAGAGDPLEAVQGGARLFSSPHLPDHPSLAPFAIAREDQLDPTAARYADDWVRSLTPEQVARYSVLLDAVVEAAERHGRDRSDLQCEVLSTLPYPLRRVMERHRLGRFRVLQKADLGDPSDVYRSENARPEDWIMLGTHDTPPIWRVAKEWERAGRLGDWAGYAAARLEPNPSERSDLARRLAADRCLLVEGLFALTFASPAQNVFVFFTDLFGLEEPYNVPGTVSDENWTLRVPPDYERSYPARRARGEVLNVPRALALALTARGLAGSQRELIQRLHALAGGLPK